MEKNLRISYVTQLFIQTLIIWQSQHRKMEIKWSSSSIGSQRHDIRKQEELGRWNCLHYWVDHHCLCFQQLKLVNSTQRIKSRSLERIIRSQARSCQSILGKIRWSSIGPHAGLRIIQNRKCRFLKAKGGIHRVDTRISWCKCWEWRWLWWWGCWEGAWCHCAI